MGSDMCKRYLLWSLRTYLVVSVGVLLVLTALGAVLLLNHNARLLAIHEAEDKALILLNRNLATHAYFTNELKPGVLELAGGRLPPGYFDPSWMSSTYAVRQIDAIFKGMTTDEYYYKECAVNARSPENEADPAERAFIEETKRNPGLTSRSEIREIAGKPHLVVMRRGETMEPPCIGCHGEPGKAPGKLLSRFGEERSFHRSVGELVSAISVRVPLSGAYADARRYSWGLSAVLLALFAALGAALYALNRHLLLKPLVAVRDKARRISARGGAAGEAIPLPAMRELRDLTAAFNEMSADVARQQVELERRVAERTRELSEANMRLETEIAERRRAEGRLVESRKMEAVGRLAGGVAHEFNNMLTIINGYSEILLSRTAEIDPFRKELDAIRTTGLRATKLTRQLLAFGRKQTLRPQPLDMNEVIAGIEETLRRLLGDKITLVVLPGDELRKLQSDPAQVEEVFLNVAMNAKEAMPFGGTFAIQARNVTLDEKFPCSCGQVAPGPYVMVLATDSGGGMDEETVAHLFEPFFTTKPFGQGRGLGLSTVFGILRQSGGHIVVDSLHGRGTTVRFCFPAIP